MVFVLFGQCQKCFLLPAALPCPKMKNYYSSKSMWPHRMVRSGTVKAKGHIGVLQAFSLHMSVIGRWIDLILLQLRIILSVEKTQTLEIVHNNFLFLWLLTRRQHQTTPILTRLHLRKVRLMSFISFGILWGKNRPDVFPGKTVFQTGTRPTNILGVSSCPQELPMRSKHIPAMSSKS